MVQVTAPGGWKLELDPEFRLIDNGDSIQAVAGKQIVYVSAMSIASPSGVPSAAQLRATAARSFRGKERYSHVAPGVEGEAEVRREGDSLVFHGVMCANGKVATCAIEFAEPENAAWAEGVWRSLTPSF